MTIKEALAFQGYEYDSIDEIIYDMITDVECGIDPIEVLEDNGLDESYEGQLMALVDK